MDSDWIGRPAVEESEADFSFTEAAPGDEATWGTKNDEDIDIGESEDGDAG